MTNVRELVKNPNKVLRKKAQEILVRSITTPKIKKLIADMKETLKTTPDGIGIAAPQVGESLRIYVASEEAEAIDRGEAARRTRHPPGVLETAEKKEKKDWKYYVFINPIIKRSSKKKQEDIEGCLSVPGVFGLVKRPEKVTVEAYDEQGKKFTRGTTKLFARLMQHEIDHLEGTLFIDKVEKIVKPDI